jgi:hypothetical protein
VARFLSVVSGVILSCALLAASAQAQASSQTTAQRIVAIAQQELALGVREIPKGSNKGARIKMYGLATQAPLRYYPAPWCAYFTSWVTKQAGVPIGWDGLGDGWVPRLRDWGRKTGLWRTVPQPGDLIAFPQHIGIVESIQPNGLVTTIEGNTGDALLRRLRLIKSASGFIRVAAQNPPVPVLTAPSDTVYRTEPVTLTVKNASTAKRAIKRYRWDLNGDGRWDHTTTVGRVTLAFPENGVFPLTVQLTDVNSVSAKASISLTVINRPGVAIAD